MHRKIILYVIILILWIPIIESQFDILPKKQLKRDYLLVAKDIDFTNENWFNRQFQEKKDNYVYKTFPLRPLLTRIRNQIDYSLFDITHANKVVVGKNNMLLQQGYLNCYFGKDYVGDSTIKATVQTFSSLQKLLAKEGVDIYVVIVGDKASIYPENIPDHAQQQMEVTNYAKTVEQLDAFGCKYLDLRQFILNEKKTAPYPLFTNAGFHWSGYAVTLAADTLLSYLEHHTGLNFIDVITDGGILTDEYRFTDNDLGLTLNLLFRNTHQKVYYPNISFAEKKESEIKPDVLLVGDGYTQSFWGFYPYFNNILSDSTRFWYYNQRVDWPHNYRKDDLSYIDLYEEIIKRDFVLIVTNEKHLEHLGFGFVEKAYAVFTDIDELSKEKIKININKLRANQNMFDLILEQSTNRNIPFDSMLYLNARWQYGDYLIDYFTEQSTSNPEILSRIEEESLIKEISLDSMLVLDATQKSQQAINDVQYHWFEEEMAITNTILTIRSNPEWLSRIENKAVALKRSVGDQLTIEAKYVIRHK